jgi:hypothetical protein
MWASAEGGTPEVTLETSMGPFTVEVLSSVWLLRKRFKVKDNITPSVFFFFFVGHTILNKCRFQHFQFIFFFTLFFSYCNHSYTTSTHRELAGTSLNSLAETTTTTLNSIESSRSLSKYTYVNKIFFVWYNFIFIILIG